MNALPPKPFRKAWLYLALVGWLLTLLYFTLFKHQWYVIQNYFKDEYPFYHIQQGWSRANFRPFKSILQVWNSSDQFEYRINNNLGNFIGYLPGGFLLPLISSTLHNGYKVLFTGLMVSVFFESLQLITGLGIFDVDDLLLNSLGVYIGYVIYKRLVPFTAL